MWPMTPGRPKSGLCFAYQDGMCKRGNTCAFAHGINEMSKHGVQSDDHQEWRGSLPRRSSRDWRSELGTKPTTTYDSAPWRQASFGSKCQAQAGERGQVLDTNDEEGPPGLWNVDEPALKRTRSCSESEGQDPYIPQPHAVPTPKWARAAEEAEEEREHDMTQGQKHCRKLPQWKPATAAAVMLRRCYPIYGVVHCRMVLLRVTVHVRPLFRHLHLEDQ